MSELAIFSGSSEVTVMVSRAMVSDFFSWSSATMDKGSLFSMRSRVRPPLTSRNRSRAWSGGPSSRR
jgi:hypothetical protein